MAEELPLYLGIPMALSFVVLMGFLIVVSIVIWRDR